MTKRTPEIGPELAQNPPNAPPPGPQVPPPNPWTSRGVWGAKYAPVPENDQYQKNRARAETDRKMHYEHRINFAQPNRFLTTLQDYSGLVLQPVAQLMDFCLALEWALAAVGAEATLPVSDMLAP